MAKNRPGKRSSSSSSSYGSTITIVVFVAFCIFGVWMLTSSSSRSLLSSRNQSARTQTSSPRFETTKQDTPAFDDNPGRLPEDATRGDDGNNDNEDTNVVSRVSSHDSGGGKSEEEKIETQQEIERDEPEKHLGSVTESENNPEAEDQGKEILATQNAESVEERKEDGEENQQTQMTNEEKGEESQQDQRTAENVENQEQSDTKEQTDEGGHLENLENVSTEKTDGNQETQQVSIQSDSREEEQQQSERRTGEESNDEIQNQSQATDEENSDTKNHESRQNEERMAENQETQQREDNLDHMSVDASLDGARNKQPSSWSTQAAQSENEKERREEDPSQKEGSGSGEGGDIYNEYNWVLCNVTAGPDYIPCLDNEKALKQLHSTRHYEHRERHCPEEAPSCLVPLPRGYKQPLEWPVSRNKIWYFNVPNNKLAIIKGHQNWVKVMGHFLTFPGGGTQFIHGALHYIDFIQQAVPKIAWGKHTRVVLDVGCGVASFGGYLFERDVIAMSFAPKDEHEAQVQFALERGIPAISAVMGSQRLPFPSRVFDLVHCARCRVPWHAEGGTLLLELNRVLRPGGYFVWSATPVYQKMKEDVEIWNAMSALTQAMCWDLITIKKDRLNAVGAAIYRKPVSNECYKNRKQSEPLMCKEDDDPNAAWYVPLQTCMHTVPVHSTERGSQWPQEWPQRLQVAPYWLNNSQTGIYGKPAPADFKADYDHWKRVVSKSYLSGLGISWANVRNVMDMKAVYGGFAAALIDLQLWVMNVVNVDSPDTLPIIYERGLFGIYHDWCESFSTYPRTYDLLHADHLFSDLKKRCNIVPVMAEVDRIVRPGGKIIVRDESSTVSEIQTLLKSLHWEVRLTFNKGNLGILSAQKTHWRPTSDIGSS